ncbi:MAG: cytochrome C, partial [Gammaproteobacteria bacterium]|nr:cytochrome C [Gammaproteobacteria bacterium]MDX2487707.1 cytochrome C [Gammaproteobacteria bacterium]
YLASNSAETSTYRRSQAIMGSLRKTRTPPLRITETPYFVHEHREIPKRIIELPEVGSLSQCNACHRYAEQGSFSEDDIWIKGIGHWDD